MDWKWEMNFPFHIDVIQRGTCTSLILGFETVDREGYLNPGENRAVPKFTTSRCLNTSTRERR